MSKKLTLEQLKTEYPIAYDFITKTEAGEWVVSKNDLEAGYRGLVQLYNSKNREDCKMEAHEKFIDIQYVSSGKEAIAVLPITECEVKVPYNEEKDVIFYEDTDKAELIELTDGEALVLFPEDAHMPGMKVGESVEVKKIVMKVPV